MAVDPAIQFSAGLPLRAAQLNQQVRDYNVQGMLGLARTRGQMAYVTAEREIGMIDPPTDTTVLQHAGTSNTPPSWAKVQGVHIQNSTITKNKLASDVQFGPQAQSIRMDHLAYGDAETWRGLAGAQLFYSGTFDGERNSGKVIPSYGWLIVTAWVPLHLDRGRFVDVVPAPIIADGGEWGRNWYSESGAHARLRYGKASEWGVTGSGSENLYIRTFSSTSSTTRNTTVKVYWYESAVGIGVPV